MSSRDVSSHSAARQLPSSLEDVEDDDVTDEATTAKENQHTGASELTTINGNLR